MSQTLLAKIVYKPTHTRNLLSEQRGSESCRTSSELFYLCFAILMSDLAEDKQGAVQFSNLVRKSLLLLRWVFRGWPALSSPFPTPPEYTRYRWPQGLQVLWIRSDKVVSVLPSCVFTLSPLTRLLSSLSHCLPTVSFLMIKSKHLKQCWLLKIQWECG